MMSVTHQFGLCHNLHITDVANLQLFISQKQISRKYFFFSIKKKEQLTY